MALAEAMPELTVVLAGAGPQELALRHQAQPLGRRVRFYGWADAEGRRELLAAADAGAIAVYDIIAIRKRADGTVEGF